MSFLSFLWVFLVKGDSKTARQHSKMTPKFAKGDRVKAYATRFDKAEKDLEEGEILFSAKWATDGNGI